MNACHWRLARQCFLPCHWRLAPQSLWGRVQGTGGRAASGTATFVTEESPMNPPTSLQPDHRKRVKHYDIPGDVHALTFSTYRRMPLLVDADRCRIVLGAIRTACIKLGFRVFAFVVMPEHVHLLVFPVVKGVGGGEVQESTGGQAASGTEIIGRPEVSSISSLLYAIKRPSSHRIKQVMVAKGDLELLERLTIRERPGKSAFRFWQEGGGFDRNLTTRKAVLETIDYIHNNPVRRELVLAAQDWPWSSWAQWRERQRPVPAYLPVVDAHSLLR